MPYNINFSDPTKFSVVVVPDMPPGINTVDTSLSLVGRGYPNYGQKISENFLHLLENFAGPIPPQNPIEGQLWYDTSDPNNKILRVMDGAIDSTRWPSATGIYKQGTDPKDSATQGLKVGDIWVDTANNQLKIFNSNSWTIVGPSIAGSDTGVEPATILDSNGDEQYVILNKIDGIVVSIVASSKFTPRQVIDGFTILKPGVNLSTLALQTDPAPIFNGPALGAQNLIDSAGDFISTDSFLRKDDQSQYGQVIDGVVRFRTTTNTVTGKGRSGIVINNSSLLSDDTYVQFYKGDNDAIILNNTPSGKIIFKAYNGSLTSVLDLSVDESIMYSPVSVVNTVGVSSTLTVFSTSSVSTDIRGGASIAKNVTVGANISVNGLTTLTGSVTVGGDILPASNGSQNLGSTSKHYRQIYADILGTTGSVFVGTFDGLARGLQQSTEFKIQGQVTGTSVTYNGSSDVATFVTSLTTSSISAQTIINTSTSSLSLLVLNSADYKLNQISRDNFLSSVFPTGMIIAYGTNTNIPSGWLLCDGSQYDRTGTYSTLFNLITTNYGSASPGFFKVPDMRKSTTATNTTTFVSYIIKT